MAASKPHITATWFGHAAFLLESPENFRILVDPWLQNPRAPEGARKQEGINLILVTHGHSDHIGNTLDLARETGAHVVSIVELANYFQSRGIQNTHGMNKGGEFVFGDVHITMVDAKHSADIDSDGRSISGGGAVGFVITFGNGVSVYHAGDTAVFGDMKIIGDLYKPQIALLPIGGYYTMGPREAAYACNLLRPKRIIGMHYGTFPILSGTPGELRRWLAPKLKDKVVVLEPGRPVRLP